MEKASVVDKPDCNHAELRQSKKVRHLKRMARLGSKQFQKTVKFVRNSSSQIRILIKDSNEILSDIDKAASLNDVFSHNFNSAISPLNEACAQNFMVDHSTMPSETILCTEEEVLHLLIASDTSKASGPDGVSGNMLKNTAMSTVRFLL